MRSYSGFELASQMEIEPGTARASRGLFELNLSINYSQLNRSSKVRKQSHSSKAMHVKCP
jgi:hypothetical protein